MQTLPLAAGLGFYLVPEGETYTISEGRVAVMAGDLTIDGTLTIDGRLADVS